MDQLTDEVKSQAMLHGAKFEDVEDSKDISKGNPMIFKHPDAYKDLPEQEKKDLTNRMMNFHKGWSGKSFKNKG